MKIIGIVAEYNPFHKGHAYHIEQTRKNAGDDCGIVAVMSGDFVQRGEAAVFSKYIRAEAACRCGADLVIELPARWALQSAERYAKNAVSLLYAAGADTLSFGCEENCLDTINKLADLFLWEGFYPAVAEIWKESPNLNYAAARQIAAEKTLRRELTCLRYSNTILAVEYLKTIKRDHMSMDAMLIPRIGAFHDSPDESIYLSASAIRKKIENRESISDSVPDNLIAVYEKEIAERRVAADQLAYDSVILSRLQMLDSGDFRKIPDVTEDLANRICTALKTCRTYYDLWHQVCSKRYPESRIRRIGINAALGFSRLPTETRVPFARILAFTETGRTILKRNKRRSSIPLLVNPGSVKTIGNGPLSLFEENSLAHDFYELGLPAAARAFPGEDWRRTANYISENVYRLNKQEVLR